jgi:hypothetical protein
VRFVYSIAANDAVAGPAVLRAPAAVPDMIEHEGVKHRRRAPTLDSPNTWTFTCRGGVSGSNLTRPVADPPDGSAQR